MSDTGDRKLEDLLRSRGVPPPSGDLAARIARQARLTPQRQPVSVIDALAQLLGELWLPRPAVALAATLIVGIVAGWAAPFDAADDDVDAVHVESFLYPEEEAS
jgi:hypothetical protein